MSGTELEAKVRELRQLQALIEEAQREAESVKDAIKAHMGAQEEIQAGEYRVTWKTVKSARMDTKALKAALPDVAARFTVESVTPMPSESTSMMKIGGGAKIETPSGIQDMTVINESGLYSLVLSSGGGVNHDPV